MTRAAPMDRLGERSLLQTFDPEWQDATCDTQHRRWGVIYPVSALPPITAQLTARVTPRLRPTFHSPDHREVSRQNPNWRLTPSLRHPPHSILSDQDVFPHQETVSSFSTPFPGPTPASHTMWWTFHSETTYTMITSSQTPHHPDTSQSSPRAFILSRFYSRTAQVHNFIPIVHNKDKQSIRTDRVRHLPHSILFDQDVFPHQETASSFSTPFPGPTPSPPTMWWTFP